MTRFREKWGEAISRTAARLMNFNFAFNHFFTTQAINCHPQQNQWIEHPSRSQVKTLVTKAKLVELLAKLL